MSFTYYEDPDKVPAAINVRLVFDSSSCELGIACGKNRTAIGGYLAYDSETDGDRPAWRAFCAIRGVGESDADAVLCCEDCGYWLKDAMEER